MKLQQLALSILVPSQPPFYVSHSVAKDLQAL